MAKPAAAARCLRLSRPTGLAALFLALALLTNCTGSPVELRLVTPELPFDRQIAEELVRAFEGNPRIRLKLVPRTDENTPSLETLASGVGDLALVTNGEAFRIDIETVIPLYPTVLHIAFRNNLRPTDIEDLLTGTTVFAGSEASPSRLIVGQTAGRLGVVVDDIHFVDTLTPHPDVIVVFAPVMSDLMDDYRDYRLFSIGTADQLGHGSPAETVSLLRPEFQPIILPTDLYPGIVSEPVVTIAVDKLLVGRSEIPATVVYDLVSEILRLKPALSAALPGLFHKLTGDFDTASSTFVVHPGVQAYIERNAPSAYERYSGVAEVAVTVLIGLLSGTFAVVRIYRIRRKNRIDTFYERAIGIRKSVQGDTNAVTRSRALKEIRQLQDSAFELLVDERLAADESFRIFITLSNDIIADLRE